MVNKTKIMDFLTGKHVWEYYQLYKNTQWFSEDEMKDFQILKLKKILKHCYENVPYYRIIIDKQHIDICNFDTCDILLEFPLLTKEIIKDNYNSLIPLNNSIISGVKTNQTGGTTGNILFKRNDSNTRSSVWGTYKRYEDWMGMKQSDKTLVLMGGHVKKNNIRGKLISIGTSILGSTISVDIYNTSDKTIEEVIRLLQNYHFSQIRSYPQFLFSVAKKLEQRNLTFNVKSISTTAEPIMPEHRSLFRNIFNAEVFDQYGCGEIGGIAYECECHEGLHIAEERVIVEQNKCNDLIITDLDNYTMPFIRYWNADQAIISDKYCSCGRKSKLINQIMGRTCDYVIGLNGQFLHWAYFWHLIFDSNISKNRNLKKFQIIQNSKTELIIRLVSDTLSEEEKNFFCTDIKNRLGLLSIKFSYETDIENTKTGKYRPVINKLF